jgi:arylformamidase
MEQNLVFLSHPWGPSTPAYANGERIKITVRGCIGHGDSCNSVVIESPNHMGTHFDFPRHFDPNGRTCDSYPASSFVHEKVGLLWLNCGRGTLIETSDIIFKNTRPQSPPISASF